MPLKPHQSLDERVARELERERHERERHDQMRAGLDSSDELRTKDARERSNSGRLRRSDER
jgi:hypothetical protein